jgi:hypothetical protein
LADHGAFLLPNLVYGRIENVLEARRPRKRGSRRSGDQVERQPFRDDPSLLQGNDAIPHGKHFTVVVSDIEDRNPACLIPPLQVFDDADLRARVQRGQGLVQEQDRGFGDQ